MGVNIRDLVERAKKVVTLPDLRNKTIAIDAMNWMYQFVASIRGFDGRELKDGRGNVTSHLMGILHRSANLLLNDVKPVYVFDGKPSDLKRETIQKRRAAKQNARAKMEDALDNYDFVEAKRLAQGTSRITPEMTKSAKRLILYMGIPVIQADTEGEALASLLVRNNQLWGVASQDYDCFLFGATRLIRNLNIGQTKKVGTVRVDTHIEYFNIDNVLDELSMTRDQLVDVGILIGTDFWPSMKGVGAKTAVKLVKDHGSLEKMIDSKIVIKKVPITDFITKTQYESVKRIFLDVCGGDTDKYTTQLKWRPPNIQKIRNLLVDEHDFNPERINKRLNELKQKYHSGRQFSITDFLQKR